MNRSARFVSHDADLLVTEVNGMRIDPPILLRRGKEVEINWSQEHEGLRGALDMSLEVRGYALRMVKKDTT